MPAILDIGAKRTITCFKGDGQTSQAAGFCVSRTAFRLMTAVGYSG
jgi:hypothetical protein